MATMMDAEDVGTNPAAQFTPEQKARTAEILRVLKSGGDLTVYSPEEKAMAKNYLIAFKASRAEATDPTSSTTTSSTTTSSTTTSDPSSSPTFHQDAATARAHLKIRMDMNPPGPRPAGMKPARTSDEILAGMSDAEVIRRAQAIGLDTGAGQQISAPKSEAAFRNVHQMEAQKYIEDNPAPGGAVGEFARSAVNAPTNLGRNVMGLVATPIAYVANKLGGPDVAQEIEKAGYRGEAQMAPRGVAGTAGDIVGNAFTLGVGSALEAPQAASLPSRIANAVKIPATFAAQAAGGGLERYSQSQGGVTNENFSPVTAAEVATGYGLIGGIGGMIGLSQLAGKLGPEAAKQTLAQFLITKGALASDNAAMQVANNLVDRLYVDKTWGQTLTEGVPGALAAGAGFGVAHDVAMGKSLPNPLGRQRPEGTGRPPPSQTKPGAPETTTKASAPTPPPEGNVGQNSPTATEAPQTGEAARPPTLEEARAIVMAGGGIRRLAEDLGLTIPEAVDLMDRVHAEENRPALLPEEQAKLVQRPSAPLPESPEAERRRLGLDVQPVAEAKPEQPDPRGINLTTAERRRVGLEESTAEQLKRRQTEAQVAKATRDRQSLDRTQRMIEGDQAFYKQREGEQSLSKKPELGSSKLNIPIEAATPTTDTAPPGANEPAAVSGSPEKLAKEGSRAETAPAESISKVGQAPPPRAQAESAKNSASDKAVKPPTPPAPWSKEDLHARIAKEHAGGPAEAVNRDILDEIHRSEAFRADPGMAHAFSGKVPSDLTEALQGRLELRRLVRGNEPRGTGADYLHELGIDGYIRRLEAQVASKPSTERLVEGLRKDAENPQAQFLADLYESKVTGKARPKESVKADDFRAGDVFTIDGRRARVGKDAILRVEGMGKAKDGGKPVGEYPIFALDEVPVDKGSRSESKKPGILARAEARLEQAAQGAKQRLKKGPGVKRGKNTGSTTLASDLVDVAVYASAKFAKSGVKVARLSIDTIRNYLDKFIGKGNWSEADAEAVRKEAQRHLTGARNEFGYVNQAALDAEHQAAYERAAKAKPAAPAGNRGIKAALEGTLGMDRQASPGERVTQAAGIAAGMVERSAQTREAMERSRGKLKISEQATKFRQQREAQREAFGEKLAELRAYKGVGTDVRTELARAAEVMLSPEDRGRVLRLIAKADAKREIPVRDDQGNPVVDANGKPVMQSVKRDLLKGVEKMLEIREATNLRKARARLLDTTGKAPKVKLIPLQPKLSRAIIDGDLVRKEPKYLVEGRIDTAKLLPEHRDALAPLVDSIRKDGHLEGLDTAAAFIEAQRDAGLSNLFDDGMLGELKGLSGRNLRSKTITAEQIELVNHAIQHIAFLSETGHSARVMGQLRDVTDDAVKSGKDLAGRVKAIEQGWLDRWLGRAPTADRQGRLADLREFLGRTERDLSGLVSVAFGKGSEAYKYTVEAIRAGDSLMKRIQTDGAAALAQVLESAGVKPRDVGKDRKNISTFDLGNGRKVRFTRAEAMDLVAQWSDPESRPELARSGVRSERMRGKEAETVPMTPADFEALGKLLTPAEHAYIAKFKELTNGELRDRMNEVSTRLDGFEKFTNKQHVSRQRDRAPTMREETVAQRVWAENQSFTKSRSTSKDPLLARDFYRFAQEHIDGVASYIGMAEPVRNARLFMSRPEVRQLVLDRLGAKWEKQLTDRFEHAAGLKSADKDASSRTLGVLVRNTQRVALWGRLSSASAQIAGVPMLVAVMTPAERMLALKHFLNPAAYGGSIDTLKRWSGYFAHRYRGQGQEIASGLTFEQSVPSTALGEFVNKALDWGLVPMEKGDAHVSKFAYNIARKALEKSGLKGEDLKRAAVARAETMVRDSQNPTSDTDRSLNLLRAQGDPLKSAWVMFTSAGNKMRGVVENAAMEAYKERSPESIKNLAAVATLTAVSLAMTEAIREFWRKQRAGFQPEEHPRSWADHAINAGAEAFNTIKPGTGDIFRGFYRKYQGRPGQPQGDLFSQFSQMGDSAIEAWTHSQKDDATPADYARSAERAAVAASQVAGIPGAAPLETVKGILRIFNPDASTGSVWTAIDTGNDKAAAIHAAALLEKVDPKKLGERRDGIIRSLEHKARGNRTEEKWQAYLKTLPAAEAAKKAGDFATARSKIHAVMNAAAAAAR